MCKLINFGDLPQPESPFTARLMAWFKCPYADDYASFIPGILFVVVLLLAFYESGSRS